MNWDLYAVYENRGFHVENGTCASEINKSLEVSARLTRSLTIFKALDHLGIVKKCKEKKIDVITIHLLGADYVEAKAPEQVFEALSRLLHLNGIYHLDLFFNGPNLDCSLDTNSRTLVFPGELKDQPSGSELYAKTIVSFCNDLYHAPATMELLQNLRKPDLIVCFNAGIWGYDSWKNTIKVIITNDTSCPCVVTSYNKEEAEDDHDVIKQIAKVESGVVWNWLPSQNIHSSLVSRESGIPGRLCIENKFWQAFSSSKSFEPL